MSLLSRVKDLFRRSEAAVETTAVAEKLPTSADAPVDVYKALAADRERLDVLNTCRKMYSSDGRVKKAHRFYARDIVRAGFIVKTKNEQAKSVAIALQKRIKLNQLLEDCVRLTSRDGDSFYEIVISDQMQIVEVSRKPTKQVHRNSDKLDQFSNPERAFWQYDKTWMGNGIPKDATWYAVWQMIHTRWDYDGETRYGTPMFAASTGAFKRVQDGELNVAVRRKIGSAQIRQHVVEGSAADVEAYKENNKKVLGRLAAVIDLFSNKQSSLTVYQGDGNIDKIGDVEHHVSTMMASSDVPEELIVGGKNLNRDILSDKKEEYAETLSQAREWLTDQFIQPLLEREWLLNGILPENVDYEIIWRTGKALSPAELRDLGDALLKYKLLGVDDEVLKQMAASYLPGVDGEILKQDSFSVEQFAQNLKGISV